MATNSARSFLDDKESLEAIVEAMPPHARGEYQAYGALTLESVFPNRILVVYTLKKGEPTEVEVVRCGDLTLTRLQGPRAEMSSRGRHMEVGVEPVKWFDRDVYFHVPQNFIFKWKGKRTADKGVQFVPHYAVLIKTKSRDHLQLEGHTYCVTLNRFRERFPEVDVRY